MKDFIIENGILTAYTGSDHEIVIPRGVKIIAQDTFKGMEWLRSVKLPDGLEEIGKSAFKGCRWIEEIIFPDSLKKVEDYAFHRCHNLKEAIFNSNMTSLGMSAFLYCDSLKSVAIPGVTKLQKQTFSHNVELETVTCNSSLEYSNFYEEVFFGDFKINKINLVGEKNYSFVTLLECMDEGNSAHELVKAIAKSVYQSMNIENRVLKNLNLNIKNIELPEGITTIAGGCFNDKRGVTKLVFPSSLKTINTNAFINCCNLESLVYKSKEVSIMDYAFRGCSNLKTLEIQGVEYDLTQRQTDVFACRIQERLLDDYYISGRALLRYYGSETHVHIPEGIEIIGEHCFENNDQIMHIFLPKSVREIREDAFRNCAKLQTVDFKAVPDKIYSCAFENCMALVHLNFPDNPEEKSIYFGNGAFKRCGRLKEFISKKQLEKCTFDKLTFYKCKAYPVEYIDHLLKTKQTEINEYKGYVEKVSYDEVNGGITVTSKAGEKKLVLKDINSIKGFNIPDVETLEIDSSNCIIEGKCELSKCSNLKTLILNVAEIKTNAFSHLQLENVEIYGNPIMQKAVFSFNSKLKTVKIKDITYLPNETFYMCSSLEEVLYSEKLCKIGDKCFDECIRIRQFDFTYVKEIGNKAFERCDGLENIVLGNESGTRIGYKAFADCGGLKMVRLTSKDILESGAFAGCTQIEKMILDNQEYSNSHKFIDSRNHVNNHYPVPIIELLGSIYSCFYVTDNNEIISYSEDGTMISIPEDIEQIDDDVFRNYNRMAAINLPKSIKCVGAHAFTGTTWLNNQLENNELVIINNLLIDGTKAKEIVIIPNDVRIITAWAFATNDKINKLIINNSRIIIKPLAFRNCINLKTIVDFDGSEYSIESVKDLYNKNFPEKIRSIFEECLNPFKLDENGRLIESTGNIVNIVFPKGIYEIMSKVYFEAHLLKNITMTEDVKTIRESAFEDCKWLENVFNGGGIERIDKRAFYGCVSLKKVEFDKNLKTLGRRCFEHCLNLEHIVLQKGIEIIPERAFFACFNLELPVLPSSLRIIDKEAFAYNNKIESIIIPEGVTSINERAFYGCEKLKKVVIPDSVLYIAEDAFGNCNNLIEIQRNNKKD